MTDSAANVVLAGSELGDARHVCAFFNSVDEEYRVLLPFMKEGIEQGEKAIHVVNPGASDDHRARLGAVGIDVAAAESRGQLVVRTSTDTYLRNGRFDQDRMLGVFERLAGGDRANGFSRSRIVCRMDWAAARSSLVDEVIEFESRVNEIWRRHDDIVVCTYHLPQFGGAAVIDIMRTHPLVIIGGTLRRNSFFVPPQQFIPELRVRRASGSRERLAAD